MTCPKAVIFDLDQTLIDSSKAAAARKARKWSEALSLIPTFSLYPGAVHTLIALRQSGIKVAIVSNSPRHYCSAALNQFGIAYDALVAWHDTKNHKPDPEPYSLALSQTRTNRQESWAVGDSPDDIAAGKRLGLITVGAMWGATNVRSLVASNPDILCSSYEDFNNALSPCLQVDR